MCRAALRKRVLQARWRRAGRHVQGVLLMAAARDAKRVGGRRARAATSVATVNSLLLANRPRRRAAAGTREPTRRTRLQRAAAAGPLVHVLVTSFEPRGDG